MSAPATILVVDDTPANLKLLADLLTFKGYRVLTARDGDEGLAAVAEHRPDLVLSDIMMPRLSGYELCQRLRADAATALLPVVLVTSLDPQQERVRGIEAGADDFLAKPINQAELFARVRSLLRIKALQDQVQSQAAELRDWNQQLEERVQAQLAQLENLGRMKHFFAPQIAEAILAPGGEQLLKPHRRLVTVVFLDLRGFTAFTDSAEPEEVMEVLHAYHTAMGQLINRHNGTLEHYAGDGLMIFFNDPLPIERPVERAVGMALAMQQAFSGLAADWSRRGYQLGLGIGIAEGYATLGAIGYEGRWEYAAVGSVANLSARLCGAAKDGEILLEQRAYSRIGDSAAGEALGERTFKGFAKPVAVWRLHPLGGSPDR